MKFFHVCVGVFIRVDDCPPKCKCLMLMLLISSSDVYNKYKRDKEQKIIAYESFENKNIEHFYASNVMLIHLNRCLDTFFKLFSIKDGAAQFLHKEILDFN